MGKVKVQDIKPGGCYRYGDTLFVAKKVRRRAQEYYIGFERYIDVPISSRIEGVYVGPLAIFDEADVFQLDKALKLKQMAETGIMSIINEIATS